MSKRILARTALLLSILAIVSSISALSLAQNNVAAAATLFNEAKKLADEKKWGDACPKFDASYELDAQLGTLMNAADCYDNLGKPATAWAKWNHGLEWAQRVSDSDRIEYITSRLKETEKVLPKLTVQVTRPDETLTVKRGEVVVEKAMWGVPIPVDPGAVSIVVLRGEQVLHTERVEARTGEVSQVSLDLADIALRNPPPAPKPDPVVMPPPPPPKVKEEYDPTHRNIGLVVGAVGIAAVLTAAGLEIAALVKKGQADSEDACVNKFCSPGGLEDATDAKTFAEVGQWVGIGGLVVLAVGVTIFFTAPSEEDDPPEVSLSPWFGEHGGGIQVGGAF